MVERVETVFDPAIAAILSTDPPQSPLEGGGNGRARGVGKKRPTPHEKGRAGRKVTITLPGDEWKAALDELADRWELRACDLWVFAVAHLMASVADGLDRPEGEAKFWQRAGEGLDLPWWPE